MFSPVLLFHFDVKYFSVLCSKCEVYSGQICSKFVGNQKVFVKPLQAQAQKEIQMSMLFRVLPGYISEKCQPYAFQALCLSAFAPCDLTVNYPKPRMFCQDECRVLEQYICQHEFNVGRTKYMTSFVPPCSQLPDVNSPEHKKCVRLNLTSKFSSIIANQLLHYKCLLITLIISNSNPLLHLNLCLQTSALQFPWKNAKNCMEPRYLIYTI